MNESTILILLGLGGVLFRCLLKMQSLMDDANSLNVKFGGKMYLKKDYLSISACVLSVALWYGIFGEVGNKYPYVLDFKRTLFVFAGYGGSSVIQAAFDKFGSSAKKYIRGFGDVKSNVSDMLTGIGKDASLDEVIEKGNEVTGSDVTVAPPAPKEVIVPPDSNVKPTDV